MPSSGPVRSLVVLAFCAWLASFADGQTFKNPQTISAVGSPQYCCVVDVNGDGKPDLVGLSFSTLTVQLNDGKGVFTVAQSLQISGSGNAPAMQVKDINGDGRLDLVIVGGNVSGFVVNALLGNGDGTFRAPVVSNIYNATGNNPYYAPTIPALGDFNGDGIVDLLVGGSSPTYSGLNVLAFGDGAGHFTQAAANAPGGAQRLFVGDFNGDGKLDYISFTPSYSGLSGGNSGTTVYLGNGDGTFRTGQSLSASYQAFMADINSDGRPDLLYALSDSTIYAYLGQADGTFIGTTITASGATNLFAVADVNGDGIPDLLTGFRGLSVLLGQGGLRFAAPVSTAALSSTYAWGPGGASSTSVVDVDGDGLVDLIDPELGRYLLYHGNGDGTFRSADLYAVGEQVGGVTLGDFNNDGRIDIAASVLAPYPRMLLGDGKGGFTATVDQNAGAAATTVLNSIVSGDFNGDGKLDVLMAGTAYGSQGNLGISYGRGDGSFLPAVPLTVGSLITADVNGDGRTDMISAAYLNGNAVTASLGQSSGTFDTKNSMPLGLQSGAIGVIDANKDGKPDLFITGSSSVQLLTGAGDGTFPTLTNLGDLGGPYYASAFHTADLDGDGYPDVILETPQGVKMFYGLPGAKFAPPVLLASAGTNLRIADIDLDGKLDLIGLGGSGLVQVLHGLGNRTFGNAEYYVGGPAPTNVEVADVNGDGYPDLVVGNGYNDTVTVLLNLGGAGTTTGKLQVSPEPSEHNKPFTLAYSVSAVGTTQALTGTVACDLDGMGLGTILLSHGAGTLVSSAAFQAGSHTITCRYPGDSTFRGSSVSAVHTIIPTQVPVSVALSATPASVLRSQTVRLIATLTSGSGVPFGTVRFMDGTVNLGSVSTDQTGIAQVDTNLLAVGTHTVTAEFSGSANSNTQIAFLPVTSAPATVTVTAHATGTALTLNSSGSAAGTPVALTASVTTRDGSIPFGSVVFLDGSTVLGTSPVRGGTAAWSTVFSPAGSHSLTAAFQANETFAGSSSATSVYRAAAVPGTKAAVVAVSVESLTSGSIVLTASLPAGAGTGSHRVSFLDRGLYVGSAVSDTDGKAVLSVAGSATSRLFTAVTVADGVLGSGASPSLEQSDTSPATFALALGSRTVLLGRTTSVVVPMTLAGL